MEDGTWMLWENSSAAAVVVAWLVQNMAGSKYGWFKIWLVHNMAGSKYGWFKIWLVQNMGPWAQAHRACKGPGPGPKGPIRVLAHAHRAP